MAAFALGWVAFVAWALATFTALEHLVPRRHAPVPARRIAIAAALLAAEGTIARALVWAEPDPSSLARAVLAWLLAELAHYAVHRAMHRVPWLWRFHRLHHDGEPLAWATAWYVHPVDSALFAAAITLGAVIAGEGAPAMIWLVVGRRAWTVVLHANIAWPSSALDRVIATPAFHHRHHREDLPPANFASTLPLLDQLFGTYAAASPSALADRPRIDTGGSRQFGGNASHSQT
ncbi:MAG TPA: sterol desaturase family protein [Kofleriaceae bacterium]|nr:sterol desaturase family protein [Kofleriaceae bacterium]